MLPQNERCAPRRAALLGVVIGEERPFMRYAVDVRRSASHHAVMVGANVPDADVIGHDDENVRLLGLRLCRSGCPEKRCRSGQHNQSGFNHDYAAGLAEEQITPIEVANL